MTSRATIETDVLQVTERIQVRGIVQGVGFRPTVWRLAQRHGVCGTVTNDGSGVEIIARGSHVELEEFVKALRIEAPPLARVDEILRSPMTADVEIIGFGIQSSQSTRVETAITPDASTCAECYQETFDPFGRRYRYPFTNCTHCGPRLSIVHAIPYDRNNTTMAAFPMCEACQAEYDNPDDRRFHAQPIACYECGPKVSLERADGRPMAIETFSMLDAVDAACTLLQRGEIVAIKGLGGFQLACDATNESAVSRLRELKHRERKPFALMVRDLVLASEYCAIGDLERKSLTSAAAPIVILKANGRRHVATSVAPGIRTLGMMLPNTALHHLLLRRMARPIVLTSGNKSDEPQCIDNLEARDRLSSIATYFLTHDRDVAQRIDDSVVRLSVDEMRVVRRARGYAPAPIRLPAGFEAAPPVLAFGGELKNTFCLTRKGEAILSQHLGDLEEVLAQQDYRHNLQLYRDLFEHQPQLLACDLHPDYLSSKLARDRAETDDLPLFEAQHHHAHLAACLVENGIPLNTQPVLGVALDGLGYGLDGELWGGEFLMFDYRCFKRMGTFKPVALPGGQLAMKEPWRNTYAHILSEMGWGRFAANYQDLDLFRFLDAKPRTVLDGMILRSVNSPLASSCGRIFDAVAAAVGICRDYAAYEGQGAVELEAVVDEEALLAEDELLTYPFSIPRLKGSNLPYVEPLGMWQALLGDLILKTSPAVMAARFHRGLAKVIVSMIDKISRHETSDSPVRTVALSGGVFQNRILLEQVVARLEKLDFRVLTHRQVPCNDGGLALGQAVLAAARTLY